MSKNCNVTLGNTGTPDCNPIASVTKMLMLQTQFGSDGTQNELTFLGDISGGLIWQKISQTPAVPGVSFPKDALYPTPLLENVVDEQGDDLQEEAPSGTIAPLKSGLRTFEGEFWFQGPTLLKELKAWECAKAAVYIVDNDSNLIGMNNESNIGDPALDSMRGIKIKNKTLKFKLIKGTDSTVQKIKISFQFADFEKDENLVMQLADEVSSINGPLLSAIGVIDVNVDIDEGATNINQLVFKANTKYGSTLNKDAHTTITQPEVAVYNETTLAAVTVASLDNSAGDGSVYTATFTAAQLATNVLSLTITSPLYPGYKFTYVGGNQVTL